MIQRAQNLPKNSFHVPVEDKRGTSEAGIKQSRKRRMRGFDDKSTQSQTDRMKMPIEKLG